MAGLLEREAELGLLAEAVRDALAGAGALILISGEAGIGKTSLIRALRDELPGGIGFVSGACEPLSVPVPLAAWRELVEAAGGGDLTAGREDRLGLARSVLSALGACSPVVAVVEDAHWADPLTLDVLRILSRRIEPAGVLVLVTYRDDELASNPALEMLVGDLMTAPAVRRVPLRALSDETVGTLAAASGLDSRRLVVATRGNPFLLFETIAAGGRLPASVRDAALARAGRLSPAARQVVDVAAVVGQRFEVGLLRALAGDCPAAVEEALARGVLVGDGVALGFRHELIREALEASMSPPRRAELHARVLAALAERPEGVDKARLAHHAELAGRADEAARYAIIAAAEAERVGGLREACLQAERALRLGRALAESERFELLVQYSRTANFTDPRLEQAVDAAREAVRLADRRGDAAGRGRASMVLSASLWSLERVVEAREAAEQAVRAFEPGHDPASLVWAYATLMRIEATSFDPAAVVATAPRAIELANAAGLDEARLDATISLALARGHRGDPEALGMLSDAVAEARRRGWTIRMVRSYVNLMTVAAALRAHEVVDETAAEALPLLDELNVSALPVTAIRLFRARSLLDRGRWEEALEVARLRMRWWQGEWPIAWTLEGLIDARRGRPGGAEAINQAWSEMVKLVAPESARHGMIRAALIESAWLRNDRPAALAELDAALRSPVTMRFARVAGEIALWGRRLGVEVDAPSGVPAAIRLELCGDWRSATAAWRELRAPYEAALAALPGDDRAAREAMGALHGLGAPAAAEAFARDRAARGATLARGPRRSTRANPAGLTRREQEVLEVLASGASNATIAQKLQLSERTVAHHVAAILHKLEVPNRHRAVERGRTLGLLNQRAR
ncbi:MAG TPA: AAA family ATPase [Solirubrobacteraceae bacterium]|nr:AAA family ATPase [Solirubrobacteraceae bacterium]